VKTNNEKDKGTYSLEMCITDGFSLPICEKFTLTVEIPIKTMQKETKVVSQIFNTSIQ
jgi:hypothetical protein